MGKLADRGGQCNFTQCYFIRGGQVSQMVNKQQTNMFFYFLHQSDLTIGHSHVYEIPN